MAIRAVTIGVFTVGLGLLIYSLTLPYYTDQKLADELYSLDKESYYKKEAELRTGKTKIMDLGGGIAIASAAVLFFLLVLKVKGPYDLLKVKTLNKIMVVVSSNLIWLLLIPGTYWYYSFRAVRGDYPPFADSIAIPLGLEIPLYLVLMMPLNIFLILAMYKAKLPTSLLVFSGEMTTPIVAIELFFCTLLFLNLLLTLIFIFDGDHFSIIVNLFFAYILLTLRAGRISKYSERRYAQT